MPPDVINLAGGWEGSTHFYCILMSTKKKKRLVLFCFLLIVYGTSCKTKQQQNFHLPFAITEIRVLRAGGTWVWTVQG